MNFTAIKRLASGKQKDNGKRKTKEWIQWFETQQVKEERGDALIGPEKYKEVQTKVREIWGRSWESVAAYKDVPRLVTRFHIFGVDGERIDPNLEDVPTPRLGRKGLISLVNASSTTGEASQQLRLSQVGASFAIRAEGEETEEERERKHLAYDKKRWVLKQVFLSLCNLEHEDEDAVRLRIEEQFDGYYKDGSDFSQVSQSFLSTVIGVDSKINQALKATNQSIIAPAVIALSFSKLGQTYRYKDRKLWRVFMHICHDEVVVTNQRGEQSVVAPDSPEFFEFTWEMMIRFNRQLTEILDVRMHVIDVVYSEKATDAFKDKLEQLLGSLYNKGASAETYLERKKAEEEEEGDDEVEDESEESGKDEDEDSDDSDEGKKRPSVGRRLVKRDNHESMNKRKKPGLSTSAPGIGAASIKTRNFDANQLRKYASDENSRLDEDEDAPTEPRESRASTAAVVSTNKGGNLVVVDKAKLPAVPLERRTRDDKLEAAEGGANLAAWGRRRGEDGEIGVNGWGDTTAGSSEHNGGSEGGVEERGRAATSTSPTVKRSNTHTMRLEQRREVEESLLREQAAKDRRKAEKGAKNHVAGAKERERGATLVRTSSKEDKNQRISSGTSNREDDDRGGGRPGERVRDRKKERKQMYAALVGVERRGEKRRKRDQPQSKTNSIIATDQAERAGVDKARKRDQRGTRAAVESLVDNETEREGSEARRVRDKRGGKDERAKG